MTLVLSPSNRTMEVLAASDWLLEKTFGGNLVALRNLSSSDRRVSMWNTAMSRGLPLSRIVKSSFFKPETGPFLSWTMTLIWTSRVPTRMTG